jgi:hypothetical protein
VEGYTLASSHAFTTTWAKIHQTTHERFS